MKTWILVADGSKARIYEYMGPNEALRLLDNGEFSHSNKPSREIAQEKRGRVFHSADGSRSAMERPSDPHEFEKKRFAAQLADHLNQEEKKRRFDRLIVVAPPKSLGELRQQLSSAVLERVAGEIDKELTNLDPADLPKHLQPVLNINA
tara:strand:- start:12934 stop:13380 length:447 start_codon:yes stop_codon:yes gene_type:complete